PAFKAELENRHMEFGPMSGEDLQALIGSTLDIPPAVGARAIALGGGGCRWPSWGRCTPFQPGFPGDYSARWLYSFGETAKHAYRCNRERCRSSFCLRSCPRPVKSCRIGPRPARRGTD